MKIVDEIPDFDDLKERKPVYERTKRVKKLRVIIR